MILLADQFPIHGSITKQDLWNYRPKAAEVSQDPYYAGGPQTVVTPYGRQFAALGTAGVALGASYGTIKLMQSAGLRPVDWLYGGVRAVEDFSPGQVFRTFQLGNWLSQYTEANSKPFSISPNTVAELERTAWFDDLVKRTNYKAILGLTYGFQFRDRTLYAGDEVILRHARMMTTTGEPHLSTAYARVSGSDLPNVHDATKFKIPLGPNGEQIYFTGGDTLWSARLSQVRAIGSEWVHRANRLAAAPFELEPISTIWNKFTKFTQDKFHGWSPTLAVKSGTASQMLGRMAVKWGGFGTAAYLGYQSLDWAVAEADIFNWTPFAEGITAGIATLGVRAHQLAAGLADITPGVRSYQQWQEETAPGSTSLAKLAAFPLVGAVSGAAGSWITTLYTRGKFAAEEMSKGLTLGEALVVVDPKVRAHEQKVARDNPIAKFLRHRYGTSKLPFIGELGRTKVYSIIGALGIGALALPFLPGALIPEKTYDELDKIYSGEQEIAVRKGRWWELGRSSYEGGKIEYFRPHWYPRMLQDARTASMHDGKRPFPLLEWFRQNFTYEPELEHYYDRPYPITGTAFEDIPVAGPLLAATIGRLIKPPKLMHTEEWLGSEGGNLSRSDLARQNREFSSQTPVKRIQERYGEIPRHELGEIPKGTPVNPYSNQQLLGEQAYRMTELTGLVGFTLSSIKEKITGTDEWFDQEERLQSARRMYGAERAYWDLEIGGGLGTCFVPGTIIKTKDSKKAIEDINVGDIVLSKGGYRTVKHVLVREPKEKCLRIRTKALRTEFTCTANHWIPILRRKAYSNGHPKPFRENNYEILEVQARDIMPGDFLFYEIDQLSETARLEITGGRSVTEEYVYYQASSDFATAWELLENKPNLSRKELRLQGIPDLIAKEALRQFRKNQAPKRIRRYVDIDKDLAYAIGWYLAEGSSDNIKLTYTMHANEIDFANRIANIFETKFEVTSSIKVEGNTLKLNIYSVGLAKTFKLFGERAHDKFIPEYLKHLPSEILKELVTGLLLGDGWEKGFTSVSRRLVKDLADCLLKLGYQVSLVLDYEEIGCGTYPQGTSRKSCVRNYLRIHEGTRQPWRFFDTAYLVAVENIEEVESPEVVYDLTIEDVHYYTADGIIVHNTEFFRRLYPHRRRQIPEYNPIRNTMPDWLPGPGDKSPDFLHGDPFIKVKEGEMRLPGEGFATRFPELRGVDPADYPLVYRYKILSDIAPYSEKTDILDKQIRAAIARKELTKREIEIFRTAKRQMVEAKKSRTNFYDYEVLRDDSDLAVPSMGAAQSRDLLSLANQYIASKEERPSGFNKIVRGYWEALVSSAQNPLEAVTPIAPASKLISMETAIEHYKRTQIFGPEIAFWENPIKNFILPFIRETSSMMGYEQIPGEVIRQRQITEYFDILEYIKNKRLAESARNVGWWGTAGQYIQKSKETTIGVNPYERDYSTLFRAVPKNERDYFNDFVGARTAKERQEILEMVPANMRRIYEAQWELRYADTIRQLMVKGQIPEELEDRAWEELRSVWAKRRTAGFPINEELIARYQEEREEYDGEKYESYANWYRRAILIPEALQNTSLPGPDWVGWHPGVDLDDIKLRVVKNEGLDIHDFGLWESDEREAIRRPYVEEAANELMEIQEESLNRDPEEVKAEIKAILEELGIVGQVNVFTTQSGRSRYQFQIEASEDRSEELRQVIKQRAERVG